MDQPSINPRDFPLLLRRRTATTAGAVILGLAALAFAWTADQAAKLFTLDRKSVV